ncbi:MAG: (2Fe-2S) ferredoxin domain-containing protein [Phycisphaerales bacterium]|nr:(2Fe-2S) ferredoxin domain-containing protein [Phycisphaerales bacterium]
MSKFERHVFVCNNERAPGDARGCCAERGGAAVRERLKTEVAARGLKGRVRVNQAGCLDQCEHGVTVVVYPEQVWYGFVKPEDAVEIVEEHLLHNRPVTRLRLPDACINTAHCPHKPGASVQLGGVKH